MQNKSLFIPVAIMAVLLSSPVAASIQEDIRICNGTSDPDQIIASCSRLVTDKRINSRAAVLNQLGNAWSVKGDFDRAITSYSEAIQLEPRLAEPYLNRGIAWNDKGELDRAIGDYDQAIHLDPKNWSSYNSRAVAWSGKGEYDRAIADLDESIRLLPGGGFSKLDVIKLYAKAYAFRGENFRLKGDIARALTDQNRAVALSAEGTLIYVKRGDTLRYTGDFVHAIEDYERALRNEPGYIPALTSLGLTYEKMGDLANARIRFEQASNSQRSDRFTDVAKSALETARARLAALETGVVQPTIPNVLPKAKFATSIPTPSVTPTVAPPVVKTTVANQGRRVALVIGNSAYKNVPTLTNPQKDAQAIAASLRNIGFDQVTLANDATREKLIDSLRAFADEAEKADWAMVYYAGHGLEVGGINYLVPIDARLAVDRDIQFEAVPLDQVLAAVDTAKKLKLVVLDACRDNPFSPRKTAAPEIAAASTPTGGAKITSRSIGRGLAEVKTTGGTLVVFAAKNGQVALDGEGDNSPFAVAMLQRIATPGVEINKVFRLVRDDVMEATAGRQEPYTYGSLPGKEDFFFVEK